MTATRSSSFETRVAAQAAALDHPVWAALSSHHQALSEGGPLARRFLPDVNLFASARDDGAEAQAALGALVRPGERIVLAQVAALATPDGLRIERQAIGVQMVYVGPHPGPLPQAGEGAGQVEVLDEADWPEMLALAQLTEPGPFLPRTPAMGRFIGIRIEGRLAAMAGERFRWPGATELSGVCAHPDFRGRGLAGRLSMAVTAGIAARGDLPFLHAWKTNTGAIALYERLGYALRTELNIGVLEKPRA